MHLGKYRLDQGNAPFLEGLIGYGREGAVPFHTPGHKQGRALDQQLRDAFGDKPFRLDVSDEIAAPAKANDAIQVMQEAEALAADAFGARHSFFLHNGTTAGIQAMLLACSWLAAASRDQGQIGQGEVVLPRSVHRSVFGGLILAGLMPRFVQETWDPDWLIPLPPAVAAWRQAVDSSRSFVALFDTYPSYYGIGGDLAKTASLAQQGDRLLLVDEAHGAHFRFHPKLPPTALSMGASATAQSAHKTLGVFTQASFLHVMDPRLLPVIPSALGLLQSTSPSFLLYAALDAGRRQMATQGQELLQRTLQLCQEARKKIDSIPGLSCLDGEVLTKPGVAVWDPTKLVVRVDELGLSGGEAEVLLREYGVQVELAGLNHVLVLFTIGDGPAEVDLLLAAFGKLGAHRKQVSRSPISLPRIPVAGEMAMSPRQAVFGPRCQLPFTAAEGAISAEIVTPYPPGIPLLVPGEKIAGSCLEYLEDYWRRGITIRGWADSTRKTIWVVDDY